jgi:uncharacterized membrane protein YfcA
VRRAASTSGGSPSEPHGRHVELGDPRFWLFAGIVALAFAAEATTGFGATVIALALGIHLFPLGELLPVFVPLGLFVSAWIVLRGRAHVARRLLAARILPWMGLGLALGLGIFESASHELLRRAFGVFVVSLAAFELWRLLRESTAARELSPPARAAALLGAGVMHGMFSTGGPLLVWALGRSLPDKRAFRATLSCVWLVLGSALTTAYALGGRLDAGTLRATGALLPVLGIAIAAGEWAHHRLDERRFRVTVYGLLLASGASSLL